MFSRAALPGMFVVDTIPLREHQLILYAPSTTDIAKSVKYIPHWFPGASFQTLGARTRKIVSQMTDIPINEVRNDMVSPHLHNLLASETKYMLSIESGDGSGLICSGSSAILSGCI